MSDNTALNAKLEELRQNRATLDECPKHRFPLKGVKLRLGARVMCTHCGGLLDLVRINDYARGYTAAGGNPEDVAPGWNDPINAE